MKLSLRRGDPAHRAAEPSSPPRAERISPRDRACPCSRSRRRHRARSRAAALRGMPSCSVDLPADVVRRLRRAIERELVGARGWKRDQRARLDRARRSRRLLTRSMRDHVRAPSAKAAATAASSPRAQRKQTLPGAASCSCGAPCACARARVGDRGQGLVIDVDTFGGVQRLRRASRRSRPRPARRHGAPCRAQARSAAARAIGLPSREPRSPTAAASAATLVGRHVGAGEHGDDARRRGRRGSSMFADARMRVRRAHEHAMRARRAMSMSATKRPRAGQEACDPRPAGAARRCPGRHVTTSLHALLQFLAQHVEPLERRLVGDDEQVGVAADGAMAAPRTSAGW